MGFEQNSTEFALVFLPALTHSILYTAARGVSVRTWTLDVIGIEVRAQIQKTSL